MNATYSPVRPLAANPEAVRITDIVAAAENASETHTSAVDDNLGSRFETLSPLPVRTRLVHGESWQSYSSRLAARNFQTVRGVEEAALDLLQWRNHSPRDETWNAALWRRLGNLHQFAFIEQFEDPSYAARKRLCARCANKMNAYGSTSRVGPVCLRHHYWTDGEMSLRIAGLPKVMRAEKVFRRELAPRGVTLNSLQGTASREVCKRLLLPSLLQQRAKRTVSKNFFLLGYPETIAVLRLINNQHLRSRIRAREEATGLPADARDFLESQLHQIFRPARRSDSLGATSYLGAFMIKEDANIFSCHSPG